MFQKITTMYATCKEFVRTTSAHGFSHLAVSHSSVTRLFWILTCILSLIGVTVGLGTVLYSYLLYQTYIKIEASAHELPFPAVTVCNQRPTDFYTVADIVFDENSNLRWNMGNFSYAGRPGASVFERDVVRYVNSYAAFFTFLELTKSYGIYGYQVSEYDRWSLESLLYSRLVQNANIRTRSDLGGWQPQEFIMDCMYAGVPCSWRNFSTFTDPAYLNCFRFDPANKLNQTPGLGGPSYGLNLMLFVPYITLLNLSETAMGHISLSPDLAFGGEGIRLSIHEQNMRTSPITSGTDAPRGTSVSIGVAGTHFHRRTPPYGNCSDDANYRLPPGHRHSLPLCKSTCLQKAIIHKCGCYDFSLPYIGEEKPCQDMGVVPLICQTAADILNNYGFCTEFVIAWYQRNRCANKIKIEKAHAFHNCHCNPRCHEYTYSFSAGITDWPAYEQARANLQTTFGDPEFRGRFEPGKFRTYFGNVSDGYVSWATARRHVEQKNFMRLSVYISESDFIQISEVHAYSETELLSRFGGHLGFWAGMSIISVVEMFHFVFTLIWQSFRKVVKGTSFRKQTQVVARVPENIQENTHL